MATPLLDARRPGLTPSVPDGSGRDGSGQAGNTASPSGTPVMTKPALTLVAHAPADALPDGTLLRCETAADSAAVERLHEVSFGPGRFARTAFRLREGVDHDPALSMVAITGGVLSGAVRLTPITIGEQPALLLGPLAVDPAWKNQGIGKALMRLAMAEAGRQGHRLVLLVGDAPYYAPFGFRPVPPGRIAMPGPVDPARLLLAELEPGAGDGACGEARGR